MSDKMQRRQADMKIILRIQKSKFRIKCVIAGFSLQIIIKKTTKSKALMKLSGLNFGL
jgi:hypothetical protein